MKKRVLLGISGGVDSAVAAKVLLDQGYEVVGGFMRNWDSTANNDIMGNPTLNDNICPQEVDYNDAKEVCKQLGIDIVRIDFVNEYWDHVFTYFINEYKLGRTPNPDILCNKFIKFDQFLNFALKNNFDYIAMGHYCGVEHTENGSYLIKAKDTNKDQTYFLSQLSQYQLSKSLFPLANYTKQEIREIASSLDLVVASKKDSTGICFIGERNFKSFLANYIPAQPGNIVDYSTKKVVGQHSGVMYYTIGQSKGLGIGGQKEFSNGKWYVMGKDLEKKVLYVSNDSEQAFLKCDKALIVDIQINNNDFIGIKECNAKFRYRQQEYPVSIEWIDETSAYVYSENLPLGITIGQACVFYSDKYCCGGGTIDKIYLEDKEINYV
ncbi:tRNA-specific 2-thiouridylase [Bacilli bacterium PM5-3]|nr:tRNA-specific 2-thiouridylase [Bacilli bacterium PM5-3]MDH6604268.1 tRNA-specific 2-thiouridylase [Bacilli bacterium PM5-9]